MNLIKIDESKIIELKRVINSCKVSQNLKQARSVDELIDGKIKYVNRYGIVVELPDSQQFYAFDPQFEFENNSRNDTSSTYELPYANSFLDNSNTFIFKTGNLDKSRVARGRTIGVYDAYTEFFNEHPSNIFNFISLNFTNDLFENSKLGKKLFMLYQKSLKINKVCEINSLKKDYTIRGLLHPKNRTCNALKIQPNDAKGLFVFYLNPIEDSSYGHLISFDNALKGSKSLESYFCKFMDLINLMKEFNNKPPISVLFKIFCEIQYFLGILNQVGVSSDEVKNPITYFNDFMERQFSELL